MRTIAVAALCAALVACGGGGTGSDTAVGDDANGAFTWTDARMAATASATQTTPISYTIQFVGLVHVGGAFAIPVTITRNGTTYLTSTATFTLVSGQSKNGTFTATGGFTLPAQEPGVYVICVAMKPGDVLRLNGTAEAPVCGSLTVS